jgi:transposase
MKYTIKEFREEFSSDDACLDYIFNSKYGKDFPCPICGKGKFYRVKKRKCYSCANCGHQLHPTADTIFHKSETKLTNWFYAIFLFSQSKNGVSAKELERQLGVTYKTAWRMARQIRLLMSENEEKLNGIVEADETYIGGKHKRIYGFTKKSVVLGIVKRGGSVKIKKAEEAYDSIILDNIVDNVEKGTQIMSDQLGAYKKTKRLGFNHLAVNHWKKEYVRNKVHTNTIEGFWSQLKRSLDGTYHSVSPKHLQHYLDEFSFRYNLRKSPVPVFYHLLAKMVE